LTQTLEKLDHVALNNAINEIVDAYLNDKKIFTCGNGGSALISSHYINDWVKTASLKNKKKFRGFCLTDNIGLVTAYANDCAYEVIFQEQCKALINPGDLLIAISGSGKSENILNAIKEAKNLGARTLGITGFDGGDVIKLVDKYFLVNSFDMQICEDIFTMFGHMMMKKICNIQRENKI